MLKSCYMFTYSLISNNIINIKFKKFMKYLFENSTHFTLTFHNKDYDEVLYKNLSSFLIKNIKTFNWYRYKTLENPLNIFVYSSNIVSMNIILNNFNSLFEYHYGIEDICFFNKSKLIFGSVTHENIADLFLDFKDDIKYFKEFGDWKLTNYKQDIDFNF